MSARERRAFPHDEERSPAAGACVLVVLGGVVVAVAYAVDEAVGTLTVVVAGALALWRSARRMSDSSATPPPDPEPPSGTVYARETGRAREVRRTVGEGYLIFPEVEHVTDPSEPGEVNTP